MLRKQKGIRLAGLFVLFFILFNFPILSIFNRMALFLGLPTLYLGIIVFWILLVAILFISLELGKRKV